MALLSALAEPARRHILDLLRAEPQPVAALVAATGYSQPNVSKHLRVLREAGLVTVEPIGQRRIYHLRAEPLAELDAWLAPYRRSWSEQTDALQRHLERRD